MAFSIAELGIHRRFSSPSEDELVVGVERLKGNAKGIDLAAFIMETRAWARTSKLHKGVPSTGDIRVT